MAWLGLCTSAATSNGSERAGHSTTPASAAAPCLRFTHVEGTGTVGAFAGLGYGFLDWLGLEVRGRWTRYFKMPSGAPNHAWSIEAGFSFFIN